MFGLSVRPSCAALFILALCVGPSSVRAQGTCFRGPIRAACTGFVVFEASAIASQGNQHVDVLQYPPGNDPARTILFYDDLPSYLAGSLGYVRVVDPRTAIGGVVEVGLPDDLTPPRTAVMARWRRQLTSANLDVGAGVLAVGVRQQDLSGMHPTRAFGVTGETALLYRGYAGFTVGADLVHGAGRTTVAARLGLRTGSYAAIGATIVSAVGVFIGLSQMRGQLT